MEFCSSRTSSFASFSKSPNVICISKNCPYYDDPGKPQIFINADTFLLQLLVLTIRRSMTPSEFVDFLEGKSLRQEGREIQHGGIIGLTFSPLDPISRRSKVTPLIRNCQGGCE